MYQNTKIMFQSFFESLESCLVNIESMNIAEQCVILFHVQKYIVYVQCKYTNTLTVVLH